MKKLVIVFILALPLIIIGVAFFKDSPSKTDNEVTGSRVSSSEKKRIRQFWQHLREATNDRIAGRLEEAAEEYERALQIDNQHEDCLYYFGGVSRQLGRLRAAETAWMKLVHINPNAARAYSELGNLYLDFPGEDIFNIGNAERNFQKAFELNQEETGNLLRLGQVALIRGQYGQAKHYFDKVTKSNFKSVEAYFLGGYIAWQSGEQQKALSLLSKAIAYSQPKKPDEEVMGEGDTKTGVVLGDSNHETLFRVHIQDIASLRPSGLSDEMHTTYEKLDAHINEIRGYVLP